MIYSRLFSFIFLTTTAFAAQVDLRVPTIEDLIKVETVDTVRLSPNGKWVAYTITSADFDEDAYISQIWIADTTTGESTQLTRGKKSVSNPEWSPDSSWLAFTSGREAGKNQIYAIQPDGGEAVQLTDSETPVLAFKWSPDGQTIAFTAPEPESKELQDRKEYMGDYSVVGGGYRRTHIWTLQVVDAFEKPVKGKQRTRGDTFSVDRFSWSPDGKQIAFNAAFSPEMIHFGTFDIYTLYLQTDETKKIVGQPGPDRNPHWSPDGKQIVFSSSMGEELFLLRNLELAIVPAEGGMPRSLTDAFDEIPRFMDWTENGIFFSSLQKTATHLFRLDPRSGEITRVTEPDGLMIGSVSIAENGRKVAFVAESPTSLTEVYVSQVSPFAPEKLTRMTDQVNEYILGSREVISWKSRDGTIIEGVLTKPTNFDPTTKYPLLCIIHGGPAGVDQPKLLTFKWYYPEDVWVGRGALTLRVNYRGSAGYGEHFRMLNIRNLGVGDSWDILSGVDYLINEGWVDPERVGCMGWSQGGYISSFLTTSSDRFAAISSGGGVPDWATYYYNSDGGFSTIQYLGDNPVNDPEIYEKTSAMTHIKNARTPTLIQHGQFDRRGPIPGSYKLRQGLEDQGVSVEMIVYRGFGHGINKPKAQRAVMWHNLVWFNHYLWGDPLPNLAQPELPEEMDDKEREKE